MSKCDFHSSLAAGFEQAHGRVDVCVVASPRVFERAWNARDRGEVKYHRDPFDRLPAHLRVAEIAAQKLDPSGELREVGFIASAEVVHDTHPAPQRGQPSCYVGPDEARTTGHKALHTTCQHQNPLGSGHGVLCDDPAPGVATPVPAQSREISGRQTN